MSKIIDQLTRLGLTEKEAGVYVALLKLGRSGGAELITAVGLPRGTVYFLLDSLKKRGLVSSIKIRGRLVFQAKPIQSLSNELERQLTTVQEQLKLADSVSAALQAIVPMRGISKATIESFEGQSDVERMLFSNVDLWHQSMLASDCCWWGFEDGSLFDSYPKWFEHIWRRYSDVRKSTLRVRVFLRFRYEKELISQFPLTEFKVWPAQIEAFSTTWIMGDYVVMILNQSRPHRAIMIHERSLAEAMRHIVSNLWKTSKA